MADIEGIKNSMNLKDEIKNNFLDGQKAAKINSHRQGIIRGIIHGIIIAAAIFNPFKIWIKILLLIVGLLLFGVIASSERFIGRL